MKTAKLFDEIRLLYYKIKYPIHRFDWKTGETKKMRGGLVEIIRFIMGAGKR